MIFSVIKGKEELATYSEFNGFETIYSNQNFIIQTTETSIAYFDTYDKNSVIYISKDKKLFENKKDERITGKFYTIEPNTQYYIRNTLYFEKDPSVFQKYLYPLDLKNKKIDISGNSINYLYLQKDVTYELNYEDNSIKKMIKLSRKTLNAKVKIKLNNQENELNEDNLYYMIPEDFKGKISVQINENDAFLKFLSKIENSNDYIISTNEEEDNLDMAKNTINIIIKYSQKDFFLDLNSYLPFTFSFSYGFSIDNNYFYNSDSNNFISSYKGKDNYSNSLKLYSIFKNINLIKNEYFSFVIKINKSNLEQKINLHYYRSSEKIINSLLNEKLSPYYCSNIISYLQDITDTYIYSDIAQAPPEIPNIPNYHHEKINLKTELGKIETSNRNFYEFYQDIQLVLNHVKDLHFNIFAIETPKKIKISQIFAFLPFNFKIEKYNNGEYRIFIEENEYKKSFPENVQKFIDEHKNIPLKTINDIDPFDYIQNWSKFRKLKNKHAEFTYAIGEITNFLIREYPLNYSDLSLNDYEFEDNQLLRTGYIIGENNVNNKNRNIIKWDYVLKSKVNKNKVIKCKVDHKKKVNVIFQNSFDFDINKGIFFILKNCSEEFHKNSYPIIIIESKNNGGCGILASYMQQALQTGIVVRNYESLKKSALLIEEEKNYIIKKEERKKKNSKSILSKIKDFFTNIEFLGFYDNVNCLELGKIYKLKDFEDSYKSKTIKHKRTEAYDSLSGCHKKALKEFRETINKKYSKNVKKPTDIIIFTDSFSYSAASTLIKGFQKTGGAITVGYFGNPKIEGLDLFDSSQSNSAILNFEDTNAYNNLQNNGFIVGGITFLESFDYFYEYNKLEQTPDEYNLNPVDYRVDIYSEYNDELYDKFINEAQKIHYNFNKNFMCNYNNKRLLLRHDDCLKNNMPNKYTHGGYQCGSNNKWDKTKCIPFYCDIGYYFDNNKKQCVQECSYDEIKKKCIYEDNYNQKFTIESDSIYYFYFANYKDDYKYNYKISNGKVGWIDDKSDLLIIDTTSENKNDINNLTLEIVGCNTKMNFINSQNKYLTYSLINMDYKETMIICDNSENYLLYIDNIYKSPKTKVKIAKYNNDMTVNDILNLNNNYFSDSKENIYSFPKNEIYLLYIKLGELDPFNIFISPDFTSKTTNLLTNNKLKSNDEIDIIEISNNNIGFLYLKKDSIYILDFKENLLNKMIRLSRETMNSEVYIENKDIRLNSDNLYYQMDDNFIGKLKLVISNEDALIEFLFKQSESDVSLLEIEKIEYETKIFSLTTKYNFLKIPKTNSNDNIDIELIGENTNSKVTIYLGYSILPYSYFSVDIEENIFSFYENYNFQITEHYKGNIQTRDDEYYCVMIECFDDDIVLNVKKHKGIIQKIKEKLAKWKIALIVIGSIVGAFIMGLWIYHCIRKK